MLNTKMKHILAILILLGFMSVASAEVDINANNLCENEEYIELCESIVGKKLKGKNTIIDFMFHKGTIVSIITVKKGENISLLADPDPSYVAKYTGEYIVYESAGEKFITEIKPSRPIVHYICGTRCKNIALYFK
tara:strand:+ start:793 stop:1197 length:405 start_codon:yes stop_codon:yes gene_type:complete